MLVRKKGETLDVASQFRDDRSFSM